ncbi:hypothetical protein NM688_g70 [Phlebia brevispora]|uniref:Uncharacterized protein n=1 Tax=Phlebia brevispora TaxID=194682 RepID=A0ACC1TF93_9APHY|nr:hypothetical protein NM688_g70 [Phlebia brevispora]
MDYYMPPQLQQVQVGNMYYLEDVPSMPYRVPNQTWAERPPIPFYCIDGQRGFPLSDAFARAFSRLQDPDRPVFEPTTGAKLTFHVQWAEYSLFSKAKNVVTQRRSCITSISRAKTAYEVAKVVKTFIDQNSHHPVSNNYWRVGPGFIELDHIYLLELRNTSVGSYQAVLAVVRQAPPH